MDGETRDLALFGGALLVCAQSRRDANDQIRRLYRVIQLDRGTGSRKRGT
jgi:hypothetical protein